MHKTSSKLGGRKYFRFAVAWSCSILVIPAKSKSGCSRSQDPYTHVMIRFFPGFGYSFCSHTVQALKQKVDRVLLVHLIYVCHSAICKRYTKALTAVVATAVIAPVQSYSILSENP